MMGLLHSSLSLTTRGEREKLKEEDDGGDDEEEVKGWIFVSKIRGKR